MFSFNKAFRFTGLRNTLVALTMLSAAACAGAAQRELDPHLVNAADVSAAKNLMLQKPKKAVGALRDLKDRLVRYGLADDATTVQNVFWLHAQAAADSDCAAAYKSIYQSAALGFVAQAPHRVEVYQKREGHLIQCVPEGTRSDIEFDAWRELRESPLRDMASIENLRAAHADAPGASQAGTQAAAEAQVQANVITNSSEQPAEAQSPVAEGVADKIKSAFSALFTLGMTFALMSILFSFYKAAGGGSDSGQAAPPTASTSAKTGVQRSSPKRSSQTVAQRPNGATKRRRVGLVRVRPWD
jgi:hypothetical protein